MKTLFATSEALPFIASGGLADVAGSLPRALKHSGAESRVVLPLYSSIKAEMRDTLEFVTHFNVPLGWRNQYCGLFQAEAGGTRYYFLDNEYYFKRNSLYGFDDDPERYIFFSKAVLEMISVIDYTPEIIHCNDWQTAMIPVFLNVFYRSAEKFRNIRTVFTIHNIAYQGKCGLNFATEIAGLPLYGLSTVEYDGCMNMMKGAIEQSDKVTTVSPTYASEILDSWYAFGLDRILCEKQHKLCGILNGIDTKLYDPAKDTIIPNQFSASDISNKKLNKTALQQELDLKIDDSKPLVVIISRLVGMKGLDLVKYILDEMLDTGIQLAILGTGDNLYEEYFADAAHKHKGSVAYVKGFIPELARKMYSGADILLMPSKSEPCGLAQMVALRYGTLPIIRETGGLKDSIIDMGGKNGNGFTFKSYNAHDMLGAVKRAVDLYHDQPAWKKAVVSAIKSDFSWSVSAKEYIKVYKEVLS